MLINKLTTIIGPDVMLVPYRKNHVQKYHKWMKSEELQRLTASVPLTLDEEYEMQETWMTSKDKLTFIVLDKHVYDKTHNEIEAMIGDTNLFLDNVSGRMVAEAEIMVAEPQARGHRRGWQAMVLMLLYGIKHVVKMFERMGFTEISRCAVFQEVTLGKVVDDEWVAWLTSSVGTFQLIQEGES